SQHADASFFALGNQQLEQLLAEKACGSGDQGRANLSFLFVAFAGCRHFSITWLNNQMQSVYNLPNSSGGKVAKFFGEKTLVDSEDLRDVHYRRSRQVSLSLH